MKAANGLIDRRARESGDTGHEGDTSSPQLFRIDGSDQVLLSHIQVWKQQVVFLLEFLCWVHTGSITQRGPFVTLINLRSLRVHRLFVIGCSGRSVCGFRRGSLILGKTQDPLRDAGRNHGDTRNSGVDSQ